MNTKIDASAFENMAFNHIKSIFPNAVFQPTISDLEVDISATSENERLLLFEIKFTKDDRQLSSSEYLKLASLREWVFQIYPGLPPVIILVSNVDASSSLRSALMRSGIVFARIGSTVKQTRHELENAFQECSIQVPELSSTSLFSTPKKGACYISFAKSENSEIIKAVKEIIEKVGYMPIMAQDINVSAGPIYQKIERLIEQSEVVIADVTDQNPNVMLELGIAIGKGKPILILTDSKTQLPFDISRDRYIRYETAPLGIDRFKSMLNEKLTSVQFSGRPAESKGSGSNTATNEIP